MPEAPPVAERAGLFDRQVDFLREALFEAFDGDLASRVRWKEHPDESLVELVPPKDLLARLRVLPRSYLDERKVKEKLLLAVTVAGRSRQSRQDVVTDRLRAALARLLPDASVELARIEHRGGAKKQHGVVVEIEMAGRPARLGMLSSGQRNALLLTPTLLTTCPGRTARWRPSASAHSATRR